MATVGYIEWVDSMDADDYRGEVAMILREDFAEPELADEIGGKGDEWILDNFQGMSPTRAAGLIAEGGLMDE